jgi:hypothetical protein
LPSPVRRSAPSSGCRRRSGAGTGTG